LKAFRFKGVIPASKSLMNRALIARSFAPGLKLQGSSACEDVVHLEKSLRALPKSKVFDCGDGGTTLRFLAFRLSREKGSFLLKGSPRLMSRPQTEIQNILKQLGVKVEFQKNGLRILSEGWQEPQKPLKVSARDSSQFLSALFLNAWNLDFDLKIQLQGKITSESYFEMTARMLKELGMKFRRRGTGFVIPKNQKIRATTYKVESDLSSLFSVASFAALSGRAEFRRFPEKSLQPDREFLALFKRMKVPVTAEKNRRRIQAPLQLGALTADLGNAPDLFPVLAVVCAFGEGVSVLYGAPQLVKKESDRIAKTTELLTNAGFRCTARSDGMEIHGGGYVRPEKSFTFDPDHDHRLAMAAALLKSRGFKIKIKNPQVVNKSFPEFWKYVGVRP
jgi:3-phosphoshikimate 1-carboxyvinyltransferase